LPATAPLAQAHARLYPPRRPCTSRISPAKKRPLWRLDSSVSGFTSTAGMPPAVNSASFHPRVPCNLNSLCFSKWAIVEASAF